VAQITDELGVQHLQGEWEGARLMLRRMGRHVRGAFAGIPQPGLAHVVYNLPLLLACDVLEQTLLKLRVQYGFKSKSSSLGHLLEGARTESDITFVVYPALNIAFNHRNAVAHDGELLSPEQCLADIAAIETQLMPWGVLRSDAPNMDSAINDRG
jgi:hypothetical protein